MTRIDSTLPAFVAGALLLAGCCGPARAADAPPRGEGEDTAEAQARALADEVLRKAGEAGAEGLGDWSRSVIDRALERAGDAASEAAGAADRGASDAAAAGRPAPAPLPAERHAARTAAGLAGRPHTAEIVVFMSLAVPAPSWEQWARAAARAGAPLALRGVGADGMRATVRAVGARLGGHDAGVAIDPRLFRLFGVERVPAVVAVPGGVPPCASRGCADDKAPPHDLVTGNIGLVAALEAIAAEGAVGRDAARNTLARLRGEKRHDR